MHKISFLWTALLSLMAASCGVAPTNLECEYQENDVHDRHPDPEALLAEFRRTVGLSDQRFIPAMTSSGTPARQQSKESHLVAYSGPAMNSMTDYYWRVRCWNGNGRASKWSAMAKMDNRHVLR
jgi:hypothetical protein